MSLRQADGKVSQICVEHGTGGQDRQVLMEILEASGEKHSSNVAHDRAKYDPEISFPANTV